MTDRRRNLFILLLVVGLLAGSVVAIVSKSTQLGLDLRGGVELVYEGEPTPQTPVVTQAALQRAVEIIRQRVDQLGVAEPQINTSNGREIDVQLPAVKDVARAEAEVGTTASLKFYDWEANALLPNGKTVASQLQTQDRQAQTISQGGGGSPGSPGAGSYDLYTAVTLAAKQPAAPLSTDLGRKGPLYFAFGNPGSQACKTVAKNAGTVPTVGAHCLLSGPDQNTTDLKSGFAPGVNPTDPGITQLTVPQGITILQATPRNFSKPPKVSNPSTQFYVLKDHVALLGSDIANPQQSTDNVGQPDVSFGFTGAGGTKFQSVTSQIAHRGNLVSGLGQKEYQHFAVALDTLLITVPYIDYSLYPDGITGGNGADISGSFTIQSAQDLATELRLGALPIGLKQISQSQVSATLGKQALHQGLIAGLAGLVVVALFLLVFYRVLGLIAVVGLAVYAAYFYALINLIPITLTLPGIAGLILTIGVAADANIVIFERVKEEIRAGRSVRQGIITGYRKGLTAIVDANVVTIMTAFILFVLATAGVKGFAFTLGIGTIVSLFTAVLATQAILGTMGSSRAIQRPSALGAAGKKREWTFDFMGASKYFFSMSGVILLVGALAIGGRGLHLGIDFTSGTQITASMTANPSVGDLRSTLASAGASNTTVQRINGSALSGHAYQIASNQLDPSGVKSVQTALSAKYGLKTFDTKSVGPTFGQTIANSAVIAIIVSLLVISVYVALRFEWKFSVPVLIALAHDLLITAGVYSLTGREVTVDTVAALLTILGYSLYDTIIVFDRVRENVPRMPRAAFSQIVNRSMAEVLTRSLATTSCTLLPILALLLFGGSTLRDFAFALLIGVASGAYSSIFIASPVLTHWKEREHGYSVRRERIIEANGFVPPYASAAHDVEPARENTPRGRLTAPQGETVSAAEFERMKRDLDIERGQPRRSTSTLTKRTAHVEPEAEPRGGAAPSGGVTPAPDIAENEGVSPVAKPPRSAGKARRTNRKHGRK